MSEISQESNRPKSSQLAVWMEHATDTGDGLAIEICDGKYFAMARDGLVTVIDKEGRVPGFSIDGIVVVDPVMEDAVIEAAESAADENIFLHYVLTDETGSISHIWDMDEGAWEPHAVTPSYPDIQVFRHVS